MNGPGTQAQGGTRQYGRASQESILCTDAFLAKIATWAS